MPYKFFGAALVAMFAFPSASQWWEPQYDFEFVVVAEVGKAIVRFRQSGEREAEWRTAVVEIFSSVLASRGPDATPRPPCDLSVNNSEVGLNAFRNLMPETFSVPDDGRITRWNYDRSLDPLDGIPAQLDLVGDDFMRTLYEAGLYCPDLEGSQ